jgi:broad specificity phosphatase PhoE
MSKLRIYLIRHGEKIPDGSRLTKRGREQVGLLGKRLKRYGIEKIISSDLGRCKESAEIISNFIKLPILYDKLIREVDTPVRKYPEKYEEEIKIIKRLFGKLKKESGTILVVSSGNVNRILISMFLGINSKNSNFVQIPTGLTLIEKSKEYGYKLGFVNDTSHLPEKLKVRQLI